MERAERSGSSTRDDAAAGERYLLLADISGYTGFMAGVEQEHGIDFGGGIPAASPCSGTSWTLSSRASSPTSRSSSSKATPSSRRRPRPASTAREMEFLEKLQAMYGAFIASRTRAIPASDHMCTACPAVAHLDLKAVLHRGPAVRQAVGSGSDLLGPAVTVAHRLLKNTVRERIGYRPYLLLTDAAATALGLSEVGLAHHEEYPDAGQIQGRIVGLGEPLGEAASS